MEAVFSQSTLKAGLSGKPHERLTRRGEHCLSLPSEPLARPCALRGVLPGANRSQVRAITTPVKSTPAQPKTPDSQTLKHPFPAQTRSPEPPTQPYTYNRQTLVEPDWTRFPLWRHVTADEWRSATWQRAHSVKSIAQLRAVFGDLLSENFYQDLAKDQQEFATMALLLPPQMINTMVPHSEPSDGLMRSDPVRRYMLPLFSDRDPMWPSHPKASRDSLHEAEMWVTEGLTHQYPTKVLTELVSTCPQYCGHCTRMDLVGNSVPQVNKTRFETKPTARYDAMLNYLKRTPSVRDVVVSGGDVANVHWPTLEGFVGSLLDLDNVRDIRLASKSLMGLPQHWLQPEVLAGVERLASKARTRGVSLVVHTHVNSAQSVTPLVAEASRAVLDAGLRDVRNQGVLLRGVCSTPHQLLDLCFALLDNAGILPYYFYLSDMTPNAEHWRLAVWEAQSLQRSIMGYLPGFATPRLVCDVPYLGKRWVDQLDRYDRERGISYWSKNYRTSIEANDPSALARDFEFYDPISTLPLKGQRWWAQQQSGENDLN